MTINKSDVEILHILTTNQCTTELRSFTISRILEHSKYKYSKVHNDTTKLVSAGYVQKGLKSSKSDTYFITQSGIELLRGLCK